LGKYYPAVAEPDADTVSKSDAIGFAVTIGNAGRVSHIDVRVSDYVAQRVADSVAQAVSKAFTRDENEGPDIPDIVPTASVLTPGGKNYITPSGAQKLRAELQKLVEVTRPELAEARDDPDAKRQLVRFDQRIRQLEESLQSAQIVEPTDETRDVVRFGVWVTVRESNGEETTYRIVGLDETDADNNWVSWLAPIARALLNRKRGERIRFKFPSGEAVLEIKEIRYE
jgi:transcription elongation factor GreB